MQELRISSEIGNIVKVENFIDALAGHFELSPELLGNITLSVVEAVNNAILSGNKQSPDKDVTLTAWKENGKFFISIEDQGDGFDYFHLPDPTLLDNRIGRGLFIMKTLSDELMFEKNGSKVTLLFNLLY